jgi:hypothetical protein
VRARLKDILHPKLKRHVRLKVSNGLVPSSTHSEIAQLLATIDAEAEAAKKGLYGIREGTARHAFITSRLEAISNRYMQTLKSLIDQQKREKLQ